MNGGNNNNHYKITVYQKTGTAKKERLEDASQLGIARALDIGDRIGNNLKRNINMAKLVKSSSRVDDKGLEYFDFQNTCVRKSCQSHNVVSSVRT